MTYPDYLDQIGRRNGTDKSSIEHDYLTFYEEKFSFLRDEKFTMFEIGVLKGGSLRTWGEFFPNATVVGIDIDTNTSQYAGDNRYVHIGDASRGEVIAEVVAKYGDPLLVIDDGSHIWHHQIETLRYFWPTIIKGGFFIMEDLHTSFAGVTNKYPQMIGNSSISAYDYILELNKQVVSNGYLGTDRAYDGFIGNYWRSIRNIDWYSRTCVIRKKL